MANTPNLNLENVNVLLDTEYAYNQLVSEIIAKINNNNLKIDDLPNDFILSTQKGIANGVASLGNDGIIPKGQLPTDSGSVERVADIVARDALTNLYDNKLVFVIDASVDTTVTTGWAMYIYNLTTLSWTKIVDGESLDLSLTWDEILNKPTVFPPETHTHAQIDINAQNISDLQNNKVDKIEGSRLVSETEIEVFNDKYSKTEIDDKLSDLSSDAIDINYSNATSSLTSTNVQGAIDELDNLDVIIRNNDLDDVIAEVIPLDADLFNGQIANYYAKQTDLSNVNTKVGNETLSTTAQNLSGAINEHEEQINSLAAYAVASGTNTYIATIAGITALTEGFSIKIKFTNANTGASTLNINGLGAKSILKGNGNALSSGNIKAGQICNLVYSSSNFQLLGEGGEYGTAIAQHVLDNYTIGTENGLIEGTMPNNGPTVAETINLTSEGQEYTIALGYHSGLRKIKAGITGLVAGVIKAGTTAGGILGTFTSDATATAAQMLTGAKAYVNGILVTGTIPSKTAQTYTPGTTNQTIASGQYLSGIQTIQGSANLLVENIKKDVNIYGKVGILNPAIPIDNYSFTGLIAATNQTLNGTVSNITQNVNITDILFIVGRVSGNEQQISSVDDFYYAGIGSSGSAINMTKGKLLSFGYTATKYLIFNPYKVSLAITGVTWGSLEKKSLFQ